MIRPKLYPNQGPRVSGVWARSDRNGLAETAIIPLCEMYPTVRKNPKDRTVEVRVYTAGAAPTDPVKTVFPNGGPDANSPREEFAAESSWLVTSGDLATEYYEAVAIAEGLFDLSIESRRGLSRTARRP